MLKSGKELAADLVVSATGLKMKFIGGISIKINGKAINPSNLISYKGMMFKGLPNMATISGYTNASWTLKSDLVCEYICRILNYMDKKRITAFEPTLVAEDMEIRPSSDLSSGYIQRALDKLPKQGDKYPWRLHQNYVKDMLKLRFGNIDDGYLRFKYKNT